MFLNNHNQTNTDKAFYIIENLTFEHTRVGSYFELLMKRNTMVQLDFNANTWFRIYSLFKFQIILHVKCDDIIYLYFQLRKYGCRSWREKSEASPTLLRPICLSFYAVFQLEKSEAQIKIELFTHLPESQKFKETEFVCKAEKLKFQLFVAF